MKTLITWPVIFIIVGCGTVSTQTYVSKSTSSSAATSWFKCNQYSNADSLGININNLSFSALQSPNLVDALQQSHVGWIRISLYWGWIERQPGNFDWRDVDTGLAILANSHINVLLTLAGPTPCWALTAITSCIAPAYVVPPTEEWANFVRQAVLRYHNQVHYWEIWNEPDLFEGLNVLDPTSRLLQYRDNILVPAAQAIHQMDSSAKVVAPALAAIPSANTAKGPELESALSLLFANSVGSLVDVISLHSYYPESSVAKVLTIQNVLNATGTSAKPLWITEEGDGTLNIQSGQTVQADQAEFMNNEIDAEKKTANIEKVFWFALTDSPNINGQHVDDYGLINNQDYITYSWTPRPTFTLLRTVIQQACSNN